MLLIIWEAITNGCEEDCFPEKGRLSKSAFLNGAVETYGDIVFDVRKQY
jgi:hypothetical protein